MNTIKLILLSTFYFLLSIVQGQSIEYIKYYDLGEIELCGSICFIKNKNTFKTSGAFYPDNTFLGGIDNQLDTLSHQLFSTIPNIYYVSDLSNSFDNEGVICRTVDFISVGDENIFVAKFNYEGNKIWETSYVDSYAEEGARTFIPLADGGAMISGYIRGGYYDPYMARIDKDGNKLFENVYYQNMFQVTNDFQLHNDGSFWISGREYPTSGIENAFVMKLDVNGNLIDKDTIPDIFPIYNKNRIENFSITNDGSILCLYQYEVSIANEENYIMRLDSNYNEVWRSAINPEVSYPVLLDNGVVFTYGGNHVKFYSYVNGTLLWSYDVPTLNNGDPYFTDYAFDDSNNVVLSGNINKPGNDYDMFFLKISGIGNPVKRSCTNPPQINTISTTIGATLNDIILTTNTSEHLKYSDILAHYWHFEDGTTARGDSVHKSLPNACPAPFWAMLVIADGVGCTDTLTIDVCTGQILTNPEWPLPNSIAEKTNNKNAQLKVYPNPFNEIFTVVIPNDVSLSLSKSKTSLVNVYDLFGKKINIDYQIQHNEYHINAKALPKGIYILDIEGVGRSKIVKN